MAYLVITVLALAVGALLYGWYRQARQVGDLTKDVEEAQKKAADLSHPSAVDEFNKRF